MEKILEWGNISPWVSITAAAGIFYVTIVLLQCWLSLDQSESNFKSPSTIRTETKLSQNASETESLESSVGQHWGRERWVF